MYGCQVTSGRMHSCVDTGGTEGVDLGVVAGQRRHEGNKIAGREEGQNGVRQGNTEGSRA